MDPKIYRGTGQDWSLCGDGTIHPTAVKGAVLDFAAKLGVQVYSTHEFWATWYFSKPACGCHSEHKYNTPSTRMLGTE